VKVKKADEMEKFEIKQAARNGFTSYKKDLQSDGWW
jgi:hypothetical protein